MGGTGYIPRWNFFLSSPTLDIVAGSRDCTPYWFFEIIIEVLCRNQPLILVVLWVTGNHVAGLWTASLTICRTHGYSVTEDFTFDEGSKLCDLLTSILVEFTHVIDFSRYTFLYPVLE
jgi:hypothetical protein